MILKKFSLFLILAIFILIPQSSFALSQSEATNSYQAELVKMGSRRDDAEQKAKQDSQALFELMKNAQSDAEIAFDSLDKHVHLLNKSDGRREEALETLGKAEEKVNAFKNLTVQDEFDLQVAIAGALPRLLPTAEFESAQFQATQAMGEVNKILIAPQRPGIVPEGDIVSDFIPQLVRQLFRFAWLAILIALTVSGIFFVLAKDNEDRVTNAKTMIYYSFIGFAVIALAFAIVKGLTDIDFFAFV